MSASDRSSPGRAIFIVEDDDETATYLQVGLSEAGCAVRRASTAEQALQALAKTRADLILMGLMLPDADGLILCATLKARFRAPVVVLSTHASDVDRALALESGALEMLSLPVDLQDLLTIVNTLVPAPTHQRTEAAQMSS